MPHVTIPDLAPRRDFAAVPEPRVLFPIPFPFFAASDIRVALDGEETAGFAVSGTLAEGGFSSGSFELAAAVSNTLVTVWRDIDPTRVTDFPYPSRLVDIGALNTEFDRGTALHQDQRMREQRLVGVGLTDPHPGVLPPFLARIGQVLGFDEFGRWKPFDPSSLIGTAIIDALSKIRAAGATVDLTLGALFGQRLSVAHFGAKGDGVTDDAPAIRAAAAAMAATGGRLLVPTGFRCLIESTVELPRGVSLEGEKAPRGYVRAAQFPTIAPALIINPAASIVLNGDSAVRKLVLIRKGLVWGQTRAQVEATFTGTAILFADAAWDVTCEELLVLGFSWAIEPQGLSSHSRVRLHRINMDCLNGIRLREVYDIPRVTQCHSWPWTTVDRPATATQDHLQRSGTAFKFEGVMDWARITDCFDFGHFRGFHVVDGANVTLDRCGADYAPAPTGAATGTGAIGFVIEGQCTDVALRRPQVAARTHGIYVLVPGNPSADREVTITDANIWEYGDSGVVVEQGRVLVHGGLFRNTTAPTAQRGRGVNVLPGKGAFARVVDCLFKGQNTALAGNIAQRGNVFDNVALSATGLPMPGVATADPLPLDGTRNGYLVTGAGSFGTVLSANLYVGQTVTLKFGAAVTVAHGTGQNNVFLAGGASVAFPAGGLLTLFSDGTRWEEISRRV